MKCVDFRFFAHKAEKTALEPLPCAALWPRALPWVLPLIVLEAGLVEIIQPYVNRVREWADFVADLKGVGLGLVLGLLLYGTRP